MKSVHQLSAVFQLSFCLLILFMLISALPATAGGVDGLSMDVLHLKLGVHGYRIGKRLTAGQKKTAAENPVGNAYAGTYKFLDHGLAVVVDKKTDRVLALFKRVADADQGQLKDMIASLMDQFGLPTAMAHDRIIYWAFNRHGAVSEEDFERAKKNKQIAGLGIIATVKLNSQLKIISDKVEDKALDKKMSAADKKKPATGTIYFIVTSDPLLKAFVDGQN